MYPPPRSAPTSPPPAPPTANYAFLAIAPKHKHKPQPIAVRCPPTRTLSRSTSSRRRASISGSPAFQTSFLAFVDTPTPTSDTPKTPHLTSHGYTAAFATYPRRGSLPDVHHAPSRPARRGPSSPKRTSAPSSPKRPNGSPKRRQHRVPSPASPFAPPSPTRGHGRPRAGSTTRIPAPAPRTPPPAPRTPKLSKIRSLTNLRARSPSPAPPRSIPPKPTMSTPSTTSKPTSKRAKRSATPAQGSAAYTKYRPMPFIQQMQMIQFLEGGSLDSHIRRHHVHAGQGTAHTGFATSGEMDIAHGYAFTDERGMIWFDEEEEWEFARLLPRTRPQRRRGIKRLLGKRREQESEDEWEDFAQDGEEETEEEELNADALLAREDDDLRAGDEDLAAFGGNLQGAWARARPQQSVLNLPEPKEDRRNKRKRARRITPSASTPAPAPAPARHSHTTALKQEFLDTAFAPPPARSTPSPLPPRATSPFRMFTRSQTTSLDDRPSSSSRTLFQRGHRHARSASKASAGDGQSFASLGATLRGGDVLDAPSTPDVPLSPTVQWAEPGHATPLGSRASSPGISREPTPDPRMRSVSPPPAAARRLGIDPSTTVSLRPMAGKKSGFMGVRGLKAVKKE